MKPVLATVVLLSCTASPQAHAQVAQFRHLAFITSSTHNINAACEPTPFNSSCFGGHLSADYQINYRAWITDIYPDWDGVAIPWKAVISTSTESAKQHIAIRGSVYNMHGDLLAVDANDFWDGTILTGVNYNELGQLLPNNTIFWTGSNQFGEASQTAMDWTTTSGLANVGLSHSTVNWLNQAQLAVNQARRFLGISPPMLVDAGDLDGDRLVDGDDFLLWQRGLGATPGQSPGLLDGDANGDLTVDAADLAVITTAFGADYALPAVPSFAAASALAPEAEPSDAAPSCGCSAGRSAPVEQPVPEPAAHLLALAALLPLLRRRPR